METTFRTKLIHDVGFCGTLAGKHVEQASAEIECAGIFRNFDTHCAWRSETPEQEVARYFAKRYADPRGDEYAIRTPLAPADPTPNKNRRERMRAEIARQFHHLQAARGHNFVPLQLGGVQSWRAEIRQLQLVEHPVVLKQYREALGLDPKL